MPLILIADGEPASLRLIREILADPRYIFIEARDGQRALQLIRAYQPDLAIVDLFLPAVNGTQLCQIIRANTDLHATRVILMAGSSSAAKQYSASDVGCDEYLTKSSLATTLAAAVVRLLSTRAQHS